MAIIATDIEAIDHVFDTFDQCGLEGRTPTRPADNPILQKTGFVNSSWIICDRQNPLSKRGLFFCYFGRAVPPPLPVGLLAARVVRQRGRSNARGFVGGLRRSRSGFANALRSIFKALCFAEGASR